MSLCFDPSHSTLDSRAFARAVFSFRNQYWLWCPVIAPIIGALVGTFLYDAFFFTGSESILNRPCVNFSSPSRAMC